VPGHQPGETGRIAPAQPRGVVPVRIHRPSLVLRPFYTHYGRGGPGDAGRPADNRARAARMLAVRRNLMTARPLAAVALAAVLVVPLVAPTPAAAEDPAKIFAQSCAPCHGKEGAPNAVFAKQGVRSFKDQAWQKDTTDAQIEKSIREGKKGTMMASFDKQFSAEEMKGLVAYVRKLGKAK